MALKDLTAGDFKFYKDYAGKMIDCWEREFIRKVDPDLIRAFYRGLNKKENEDYKNDFRNPVSRREHYLTYSRIFQGTNTILPNLYYQNPRVIATPLRNTDDNSAALMSAVLNYYMRETHQKEENQEAVLNAWFFGIGWKKIGYQTFFMPRDSDPETQIEPKSGMIDMIKGGVQSILGRVPDNVQAKERPDIVDFETLVNSSESPLNIMVDHKASLRSGKAKLHRLKRTLYELKNFGGGYDDKVMAAIEEKLTKKGSTRLDDREVECNLNELHIQQRNGIWMLTWIDEYDKEPMRYEKSEVEDAFESLVFTNEPGVRYPTSHMKVATQVQEHIDYLATLGIRIMDKLRNQLLINKGDLAPGQQQALERNKIGGIVLTNKPINQGTFAQLQSAAMSNDIPVFMQLFQQNVTEIMGTDEQIVAGNSKNKTLGQDKLANIGTQIRESGMLDKVHDWMIRQKRKEATLIKMYSNAELHVQITGKDYSDPQTGQQVEDQWVSFMTPQNPLGLKHYVGQSNFDIDINIYEAVKPDNTIIRQQYMELIQVAVNPEAQQALLSDNKRIKVGKLFDKVIGTFDAVGNTDEFIEDLNPQQVAAIQAQQVMQENAGQLLLQKEKGRQDQQKQLTQHASAMQQGEQQHASQMQQGDQQQQGQLAQQAMKPEPQAA